MLETILVRVDDEPASWRAVTATAGRGGRSAPRSRPPGSRCDRTREGKQWTRPAVPTRHPPATTRTVPGPDIWADGRLPGLYEDETMASNPQYDHIDERVAEADRLRDAAEAKARREQEAIWAAREDEWAARAAAELAEFEALAVAPSGAVVVGDYYDRPFRGTVAEFAALTRAKHKPRLTADGKGVVFGPGLGPCQIVQNRRA